MSFPFELEELAQEDDYIDGEEYSTPTEYGIDFSTGQLTGNIVTGIEAIKVWIWLALNTVRYRHVIFSWEYGTDIESLIGKSYSQEYINDVVPDMIKDCLLINKNILEVTNFNVTMVSDKLIGSFTAITNYGEVEVNV